MPNGAMRLQTARFPWSPRVLASICRAQILQDYPYITWSEMPATTWTDARGSGPGRMNRLLARPITRTAQVQVVFAGYNLRTMPDLYLLPDISCERKIGRTTAERGHSPPQLQGESSARFWTVKELAFCTSRRWRSEQRCRWHSRSRAVSHHAISLGSARAKPLGERGRVARAVKCGRSMLAKGATSGVWGHCVGICSR
jgi:hypothetical protein